MFKTMSFNQFTPTYSSPRSAYYYNGLGIQLPTVMEHTSYYVLCEKFYP